MLLKVLLSVLNYLFAALFSAGTIILMKFLGFPVEAMVGVVLMYAMLVDVKK